MAKKYFHQWLWDVVGIPFRLLLFDQKWLPYFKWTTLEEERINAVLPLIKGRLLDVGAGPNTLVKCYGNGIGVDIFDWGGGALLIEDSAHLPFRDRSFDTVSFIAALNHIPNRKNALREAQRVLKPGGRLILTMIGPVLGSIGHKLWWYGEHNQRGGMKSGEVGGMTTKEIVEMCRAAGFVLRQQKKFVYGMNNLYIFEQRHIS